MDVNLGRQRCVSFFHSHKLSTNAHLRLGGAHKVKYLWLTCCLDIWWPPLLPPTFSTSRSSGSPPSKPVDVCTPRLLYAPILFSLATIVVSPHIPAIFLPNFLPMHTFLVVPFLAYTPVHHLRVAPTCTLAITLSVTTLLEGLRTDFLAVKFIGDPPLYSFREFVQTTFVQKPFFFPTRPEIATAINIALATPVPIVISAITRFAVSAIVSVRSTMHARPAQSSMWWDTVWTYAPLWAWIYVNRDSGEKDRWSKEWHEERGRGVFYYLVGLPEVASLATAKWVQLPGIPRGSEVKAA
jgi:hypothetical protein